MHIANDGALFTVSEDKVFMMEAETRLRQIITVDGGIRNNEPLQITNFSLSPGDTFYIVFQHSVCIQSDR